MSHLSKYSTIRAGNTLDRHIRSIDIPLFIHSRHACFIDILCCDLSVCEKLIKPFLRSYKSSLAVGCRVAVCLAKFCLLQPWGLVRYNLGVYHLADVAVDRVVSQCRWIRCLHADLAVRYQSKFDESLESVTDSECQTVALTQKLVDCLGHLCIAECGSEELCRSFRLISCGESAWEHDDLWLVDRFHKLINGITDVCGTQVLEYLNDRVRSGSLECLRAVVLTVGSREYRNEYGWLCYFILADIDFLCIEYARLDLRLVFGCACFEYLFECSGPCCDCLVHSDVHLFVTECLIRVYFTDHNSLRNCLFYNRKKRIRNLGYNVTESCSVKHFCVHAVIHCDTEFVTESHLADCCRESFSV